ERCLAKEPARRYRHAGEIAAALEMLGTRPGGAIAGPRRARPRLSPTRVAALAAVLAVAVALALLPPTCRERLLRGPDTGRIASLAVLPLENLSRDPEQEYFADGMTDELITDLAKIGALR